MKRTLLALTTLFVLGAQAAPVDVTLPRELKTRTVPFLSHTGPGPFDNALALNVEYEPIKALRPPIEKLIRRPLKFLTSWVPEGEAHVTTITPVEYWQKIRGKGPRPILSMEDIDRIANRLQIQSADLTILGLGTGKKVIDGVEEETFFVIVESQRLREIRLEVWKEFVRRGGDPSAWDPAWFFPHITIGYTKNDIHEPDVLKNIQHSWDKRFRLRLR